MPEFDYLQQNISEIRQRVATAAERVGREPGEITIVAVSKTFSIEQIREAYNAGMRDFGENYLQEAADKVDALDIPARWHFLGHLQKNKVKPVVQRFGMIQSVDSPELIARINRIAAELGKTIEVLVQVNIACEERKSGATAECVISVLEEAQCCSAVQVRGLMLIPPFYDKPEENRRNFAAVRELSQTVDKMGFKNWENRFLSMGMTDDFEIAIEEGSNMVRIGRAIFGPRERKQ